MFLRKLYHLSFIIKMIVKVIMPLFSQFDIEIQTYGYELSQNLYCAVLYIARLNEHE